MFLSVYVRICVGAFACFIRVLAYTRGGVQRTTSDDTTSFIAKDEASSLLNALWGKNDLLTSKDPSTSIWIKPGAFPAVVPSVESCAKGTVSSSTYEQTDKMKR